MPIVRKGFVAVVLQSDLSRGVLDRVAKKLPAEISEADAGAAPGSGSRGMALTKRHGQKHSVEKINEALDMIRRGENPFRAAKKAGIARTTLLYHLEKMPDGDFPGGGNPIIARIYQQIELLVWKTRLRLIKNMFVKSRKADEKMSALMWKYVNDSTVPSLGGARLSKPIFESATAEDTVRFREFIIERKGKKVEGQNMTKENLAEAGVDIATAVEKAVTVDAESEGKEG
ncbi:MAG: hypothetical protein KCHDKBKB_01538 [Elusimicrobia bacterium]|nr:hypothetical protein [Elusimicrobiota bacterium]